PPPRRSTESPHRSTETIPARLHAAHHGRAYEGAIAPRRMRHQPTGNTGMKTRRRMNTAFRPTVWTPGVAAGQTMKHASIGIGVQHTLVSRCSGGEARILRGMAKRATASARARAVPEKALVSVGDHVACVRT